MMSWNYIFIEVLLEILLFSLKKIFLIEVLVNKIERKKKKCAPISFLDIFAAFSLISH